MLKCKIASTANCGKDCCCYDCKDAKKCEDVCPTYLELGKDDMFLSVINKLKVKEDKRLKYYALIIYHSYKEEYDKLPLLKEKYNSSTPIPQLSHFDEMLAIIEKCQNGIEYSDSELETVKKVKSDVMKKILSLKNK